MKTVILFVSILVFWGFNVDAQVSKSQVSQPGHGVGTEVATKPTNPPTGCNEQAIWDAAPAKLGISRAQFWLEYGAGKISVVPTVDAGDCCLTFNRRFYLPDSPLVISKGTGMMRVGNVTITVCDFGTGEGGAPRID
jgi:hypothetical protein